MLIDTHVHLNFPQFKSIDTAELLKRAKENNVDLMINAGSDYQSCIDTIDLANKYSNIYAAIGIHPHHAEEITDDIFLKIEKLSKKPRVVAIGEVGLDYYYDNSKKEAQIHIFKKFIDLASSLDLPLIIHDREAHADILNILKEELKSKKLRGVMHCFSGDVEFAKEILALGFYISFTGPITFKNGYKARETAKSIPIEKLMVETDCPFLAPEPFRGKTNEPAFVRFIAEKLA